MREILFKAKRIDNGEWVVGQYVNTCYPGKDKETGHFIVVYPVDFIGDPVLEENIHKMLSVVREYIEEDELHLSFRIKTANARWDSEKLKYSDIAYEHQMKMDKLVEKMNEGISPYFWYVSKVSEDVVFNGIFRKVDYAVCLEKIER